MGLIIKDIISIQFYRLNDCYKKIRDEISIIEQTVIDIDIEKLKNEKRLIELKNELRKIESNILEDIERCKCQ